MAGLFGDSFKYYIAANKLFSELNDTFGVAYSYCGIGNALRMKADYQALEGIPRRDHAPHGGERQAVPR